MDKVALIRQNALWMRRRAVAMVHQAQLGHPGGDFSAIDIIATTTKDKGVSFMERKANWHHGVPNAEQFSQAMKELV